MLKTVFLLNAVMLSKVRAGNWNGAKARQLLATQAVARGELLLVEPPLVFAALHESGPNATVWELTRQVACSPALAARLQALQLYENRSLELDAADLQRIAALATQTRLSPARVTWMYRTVATNNVVWANAQGLPEGSGIYASASRSNHSCEPSAAIGCAVDDRSPQALVHCIGLVALRELPAGAPVTWNYLGSEDFLQSDWLTRNLQLLNEHGFVCDCARCRKEVPRELRGVGKRAFLEQALLRQPVGTLGEPAARWYRTATRSR